MSENKNTQAASRRTVKTVSGAGPYQVLAGDDIIKVVLQVGSFQINLPDPANPIKSERPINQYRYSIVAGFPAGKTVAPQLVGISAAGTGTINQSTTGIILSAGQSADIYWDDNANGAGVGGWLANVSNAALSGAGNTAWADGLSTVALAPIAQTTGAAVGVMAALLDVLGSGFFRGACQLAMTATSADVLTCKVVTRTQTATVLPLGNNTASGQGCQFQAAAGGITYTGGPAAQVHLVYTVTILAGVLTAVFQWAGRLSNGATQVAYPAGNHCIFEVQHGNSAHTTTFSGSGAVGASNSLEFAEV